MSNPATRRKLMLEVLGQFRVLLRTIREHYGRVEERSGLGGAQLWALAEIGASPGLSVGNLARQLAIHLSTASNLVTRLVKLGLVRRSRIGVDQRVVQLEATPKGRKVLRAAPRPLVGVLQKALLEHPPARLEALQRELDAVLRRMKFHDARATRALPMAEILSRSNAGMKRNQDRARRSS